MILSYFHSNVPTKLNLFQINRIIFLDGTGGKIMKYRLEALRDEKNLTKTELAKIIGVVESVYSEWENNKLSIPTRRLYQLANFFEVNIDYMLGLTKVRISLVTPNEIDISIVSERLRKIRKSLNLSMQKLANKFNTSSSAISNYENCKYLILGSLLVELSVFSNYSIDWILGRTEEPFLQK